MILSRATIEVLSDLVENRLAMMCVSDQDDLREKIVLKRALSELRGTEIPPELLGDFDAVSRRGRRRKVATMGAV